MGFIEVLFNCREAVAALRAALRTLRLIDFLSIGKYHQLYMSFITRSVNMVLEESATVCPLLVGGGRSLNPPTLVGGS
ncbi:hypothetical protein NTGBS_40041 [Candidatus Nitrotoga sp. BS]|uniref:hypothetical protein n=1 Tax=Candidatus Nitrotoga sp. BS TaxID=2890408 RepID=UPI001EF36432|nr:hypothetical protein [Candidatus Nitrotoga sp. BS]CAH1199876.1 hypothetical protein NTGBS_40041 [Candidatus Nitrotoga sp. BS]